MKRAFSTLAFLFLSSSLTVGCGMFMPPPAQSAEPTESTPKSIVPKESQDALRKGEQDAYARADDAEDERLDKLEKDALKAIKLSLGQESQMQGMPPPESASTSLKAIKAAKMKLRLEPVTDADGKAVNDDFLQLKDSFTDRVMQLNRKIADGKASKAEMKEIQKGAKFIGKLNDLKSQVSAVSMQVMMTNNNVQTSSLTTMLRVSGMVKSHKQYEMELNADDYALVKRGLVRQKRAEAIAASTMAMLAAYSAIINNDGDPKALDIIADATAKSFPVKVEVTDDDAKQYVSQLGANVDKVKARYEAQLRKVHGDAKYEKTYKQGVDAMFAQASNAQNAKSITQIANDTQTKYKEDVVKCKHGEDPGPASMVGASCKAIFRAAQTGDTSDLLPGAKKAFDETGGANASGGGGGDDSGGKNPQAAKIGSAALGTKGNAVLGAASAVANGDVDGMLDSAGKLFPGDSTIGASLRGISALKHGDAKGAITAALSFVPIPGLKDAFGLASKLLFKS